MDKPKILVTGAAGFIGGYLFRKLKQLNYDVVGLDNFSNECKYFNNEDVVEWDLKHDLTYFNLSGDVSYLTRSLPLYGDLNQQPREVPDNCNIKFDYIFHLAALISVDDSLENPEGYYFQNFNYTKNVLDFALRHGSKVIYASTSEIYGTAQYEPMDEKHPKCPQSPYGLSKLMADELCGLYKRLYGLDVKIFRNFNTFGFGQSDKAYIPKCIRKSYDEEPMIIFGSGEQARDYNHVTRVVNGYLDYLNEWCLMDNIRNYGSGWCPTIKELAQEICGYNIVYSKPREGEVNKLIMRQAYEDVNTEMYLLLQSTIIEYVSYWDREEV